MATMECSGALPRPHAAAGVVGKVEGAPSAEPDCTSSKRSPFLCVITLAENGH